MMCKKEAIIFHIYGKKIFTQSHLTQVQAYFYKTFKEFKNDLSLWKTRKAKYSILVSILYIFRKIFLTELHIYLCKSHHFLVSCFDSGHIFQKMWLFWKIHFVIFFCEKYLYGKNWLNLVSPEEQRWLNLMDRKLCDFIFCILLEHAISNTD